MKKTQPYKGLKGKRLESSPQTPRNMSSSHGTRLKRIGKAKEPPTKKQVELSQKKVLPDIARDEDVLTGSLDNVPSPTVSMVRIFLSSTFTDFKTERNALSTVAYPKLKQFCADLGLDFSVADMRWGVTDDTTSEHQTESLCIKEIHNCQRLSYGPNFVLLLGNRYGYQPFPNSIEEKEFDLLKEMAESLSLPDLHLLDEWYLRDKNAGPVSYVLQPIKSKLPHYGDTRPEYDKQRLEAKDAWWKIESKLQKILQSAATEAYNKGHFSADRKHYYVRSVTESEASHGIMGVSFPKDSCLCYMRDLNGVEDDLDNNLARRHTDAETQDGKSCLKEESQNLREDLKNKQIHSKLPEKNIRKYTVDWQPSGVDPNKYEEHEKYIRDFCNAFEADVQWLILQHKKNLEKKAEKYGKTLGPLLSEVHHHLIFCNLKCEIFHGREEEILIVEKYVLSNYPVRKPLVVYASSGSGKTALMAMLAKRTKDWLGKDSVVMIRFLGTSGESSNILRTVATICQQICVVYNIKFEVDKTHQIGRLTKYFHHLLLVVQMKGGNQRPLVIFLDSLDQLSTADHAHNMTWLPKVCPKNVSIIVSSLPSHYDCLANLQNHLGADTAFLHLQPLSVDICNDILESYLSSKHRTVSKKQHGLIIDAYLKNPSPLFLKLLLDDACTWKSYTAVKDIDIAKSAKEAICRLFEKLEVKYGEVLVRFTLGYLTIGRNGLSKIEIEDALSSNDEVLSEVYQYHDPPVQGVVRIPTVLLSRLFDDINLYIVENQTDGKTTLCWYHRQFIEAAKERYAFGLLARHLHTDLSQIYLAEEGITRTVHLEKRKLTIENADRQVTKQPMAPTNRRMINSLTHHLLNSGDVDALKENAFCRLAFLETFIRAKSVPDLVEEISASLQMMKDEELHVVRDCLRFSEKTISNDLAALPVQIWGLLGQLGDRYPHIQSLCEQCKTWIHEYKKPLFNPVFSCLPSPTGELKNYIGGVVEILATSTDNTIMVVEFRDDVEKIPLCQVISMETFSLVCKLQRFEPEKGLSVTACRISDDKTRVFLLTTENLQVYDTTTGTRLHESGGLNINNNGILNSCIDVSPDNKTIIFAGKERLCLSFDRGKSYNQPYFDLGWHKTLRVVNSVATLNVFFAASMNAFTSIHTVEEKGKKTGAIVCWDMQRKIQKVVHTTKTPIEKKLILLTSEQLLIFATENGRIGYFDLQTEKFKMANLISSTLPKVLGFSFCADTGLLAFFTSNNVLSVWRPSSNELLSKLNIDPTHKMSSISWFDDKDRCITGDTKGNMKLWDLMTGDEIHSMMAHKKKLVQVLSSLDGYYMISYGEDSMLKLWDWETILSDLEAAREESSNSVAEDKQTIDSNKHELQNEDITSMDVTANGQTLVTCSKDTAPKLWKVCAGSFLAMLEGDSGYQNITFCEADNLVVGISCINQRLTFWERQTGEVVLLTADVIRNRVCLNFTVSKDKSFMVGLSEGDEALKVWSYDLEARGLKQLFAVENFFKTLHSLQLDDAERFLIFLYNSQMSSSGCQYHFVKAVDLEADTPGKELLSCKNAFERNILGKPSQVRCYCYAAYNQKTVMLGCYGVCPMWHLEKETAEMKKHPNNHMWFKHSTAKYFYKQRSQKNSSQVSANMDKSPVTVIAVSRCRKFTITGADDGSIILWLTVLAEAGTEGDTKKYLLGHTAGVTSLSLSKNAKLLLSGAKDTTIRLWKLTDVACEIASILIYMVPDLVRFTDDEKHAVTVGNILEKKKVLIFELKNSEVEGSVLPVEKK